MFNIGLRRPFRRILSRIATVAAALALLPTFALAEIAGIRDLLRDYKSHVILIGLMLALFFVLFVIFAIDNIRKRKVMSELNKKEAEMTYRANYDELTGLYSRPHFCRLAHEAIVGSEEQYAIVRWDIARFKVYNDLYGVEAGDKLLKAMGGVMTDLLPEGTISGRLEADHFACCLPVNKLDIDKFLSGLMHWLAGYGDDFEFVPSAGIYIVSDKEAPVTLMCDRALLAQRSVKDNYHRRYAYFDGQMRQALMREQQLIADMRPAIEEKQFVLYFQPQYNYETGAIFGAEALVRWKHPTRGFIPPNEFIPVFEKSGFIMEMDQYIWDMSCQYLRHWMDHTDKFVPITVSVNVSRIDIYNPDLIEKLTGITQKYNIPVSSLKLEITESAYVEKPEQLIDLVTQLKRLGFIVEMDDFGSGYSSLNTLKDVPVDVLKLDLRFLAGDEHTGRGGNILSSVVRMARWLDMPVIAEGVETREQAEYLKSIGCVLMQGYYFAKPMPAEEFEKLIYQSSTGPLRSANSDSLQDFDELWDPRSPSAKLFTSFIGGAAILEHTQGNLEALRINDRCFEIFNMTREGYSRTGLHMIERIFIDDVPKYLDMLKSAKESKGEATCEARTRHMEDSGVNWLRTRVRLIASTETSDLYFASIEDISAQKHLSATLDATLCELELMMRSMPGGVFRYKADESEQFAYISPGILTLLGYTEAEFREKTNNRFSGMIFEKDRQRVLSEIADNMKLAPTNQCEYRVETKSGELLWVYDVGRLETDDNGQKWFSVIITDINKEKHERHVIKRQQERYRIILEQTDTVVFEWDAELEEFYHSANFKHYEMSRRYDPPYTPLNAMGDCFHPQDIDIITAFTKRVMAGEKLASCTVRVKLTSGGYQWSHIVVTVVSDNNGSSLRVVGTISNIDDVVRVEQAQKWQEERYRILMEDMNVATFDYDPVRDVMTRSVFIKGEGVREKTITDYTRRIQGSSVMHPDSVSRYIETLREACKAPMSAFIEYQARYDGEEYRWVRARYVSLPDENGHIYRVVGKIDDVQDEKEFEANAREMKRIAETDDVSGLYSRAATEKAIGSYLASIRWQDQIGALIMLDIDNFKSVNDTYGHIAGDELIKSVGGRLRDSFRETDVVGRIGGDEFMILLPSVSSVEKLGQKAEALLRSISDISLPQYPGGVKCSLGAVVISANDRDYQALYKRADDAMYEAKNKGKNQFVIDGSEVGAV